MESVLARQRGQLEADYIRAQLVPLLEIKEDSESMGKLERLIAALERRLAP